MPADVAPLEVGLSLVLVFAAIGISIWQRLGLAGSIVWSSARALIQMVAIGIGLIFVLSPNSPVLLSWLWVVVMVVFAAETTVNRSPLIGGLRPTVYAAYVISAVVSLGVVFGLGIFEAEPRAIVPIGGMVVGNALTVTVLVARRVVDELRVRRDEVEARLALGHPSHLAARPYIRQATRDALIPQLERTKAIGIIFLPGAMTGLILAGVDPLDAALVQLVIMYLVLGTAATAGIVTALGASARSFTSDHRLILS